MPTAPRASRPRRACARSRSRLEQEFPESRQGWTNGLVPLREYIVDPELRIALFVLLGAVGAVLLIACANLASLTLVRGAGRAREIGVRLAIGASRGRLLRQLFAESLLLSAAGGGLGVALAVSMVRGPAAGWCRRMRRLIDQVAIDGRVLLAVTAAVSLLTAVFFGVLPALTTSGVRVTDALKEGSRGSRPQQANAGGSGPTLVVGEIAAAVVLLVAAGLLAQKPDAAHERASRAPTSIACSPVAITLPGSRYPQPAVPRRVRAPAHQRGSPPSRCGSGRGHHVSAGRRRRLRPRPRVSRKALAGAAGRS